MSLNEDTVEQAALGWFEELGYTLHPHLPRFLASRESGLEKEIPSSQPQWDKKQRCLRNRKPCGYPMVR